MDYIRWLIKKFFGPDPSIILPMMLLAAVVTGVGFFVHPIVGVFLLTIALAVFGTVAYVFISDWYRRSYAEFYRNRTKP
jgi:membrane protein implicated in regulation of membrane protease activity